jgi:HlyD family secretion protein
VVVDRAVDVGQTVAASLQTPTLFKIAQDLSEMQIHASFAEADIGSIRTGQTARFTVDAFPEKRFEGEVAQIRLNPVIQQNVVTYDVVIDVDNPEHILLPGMTAYVNITVAGRKDVLLVPNAALRFKPSEGGGAKNGGAPRNGKMKGQDGEPGQAGFPGKVYTLEQGQLTAVEVLTGITDSHRTEIVRGGIREGDQVVVGEALPAGKQNGSSPLRMRF